MWLVHGIEATEAPLEPSSFSVDDAAFAVDVAVGNLGFIGSPEFDNLDRESEALSSELVVEICGDRFFVNG